MGAGSSLVTAAQQAEYNAALDNVFQTFARPFTIYLDAQVAVINTSPDWAGPFGQQDQNAFNPPVTPQPYTITGCILYGKDQMNDYMEPYYSRRDASQLKLRESDGTIRIKVQADGYALLKQAKAMTLDGFNFVPVAVPRPHGLFGSPTRWTFTYEREG